MSSGLRKLWRSAGKDSGFEKYFLSRRLSKRVNRFARRLKVEELEERIAPAAVVLAPDGFATWDIVNDNVFDATDGFIALGSTSTVESITVSDLSNAGPPDTATLNITVLDTDGAGAETIVLYTNMALGNIDLTGLDAGTTTLTLIIASGVTSTGNDAANPDQDVTINGIAYTAASQTATAANVGDPAIADTGENFTGLANAGMGTITFGATNFTGLVVTVTLVTNGTGNVGTITASDADTDMALTVITGTGSVGDITLGGILTGATVKGTLGAIAADEITGPVKAGTITGAITSAKGTTSTGTITTTGTEGNGDFGGVVATTGSIAGAIDVDGDLTGKIEANAAGGTVGNVTIDGDIGAVIEATDAAGTIGSITAGSTSQAITSGTTIGAINITNALGAAITAGGVTATTAITSITLGSSAAAGDITATLGNIGNVKVFFAAAGDITAAEVDKGTIADIDIGGALTGAILAAKGFSGTSIKAGSIGAAGSITATKGVVPAVTVNGNMDGTIAASEAITGLLGKITVAGNLSGVITQAGDGDLDIDVTGALKAATGADRTISAIKGNLTITAGSIATDAGGFDLTLQADKSVTITAGTITKTSGETLTITADADTTTDGTLKITTTGAWTSTGGGTITMKGHTVTEISSDAGGMAFTTLTATDGGITTVDAGTGLLAFTSVIATKGDITTVKGTGINITTKIEATAGQVHTVDAGGADGTGALASTGDIISKVAVGASPVLTVIDSSIKYTVETSAVGLTQAKFDLTFDPGGGSDGDNEVSVVIDNVNGVTHDISLKTVKHTPNNSTTNGASDDTEFDLTSLAFAGATTNTNKKLDNILVEGDVLAGGINLTAFADIASLVIQDDLAAAITTGSIDLLAAATLAGGAITATTAVSGTPSATAPTGTFDLPMNPANTLNVFATSTGKVSFTDANTDTFTFGNKTDADATITFANGVLTGIGGDAGNFTLASVSTDLDLSTLKGAVTVTGDVDAALTLNSVKSGILTIGGKVSTAGSVTGGEVGGVAITGDVAGQITLGKVTGSVSMADVSAIVTLGDITTTLTLGALTANVTTGSTGGVTLVTSVSDNSSLTIGDLGGDVTITGNMLGALSVGDAATEKIDIQGDFGSFFSSTGDVQELELSSAVKGSDDTVIAAIGNIDLIDASATAGDLKANIFTGGDLDGGANTMTITLNGASDGWIGSYTVGIRSGVTTLTVDGLNVFSSGGAAVSGTATEDSSDNQDYTITDIILDGTGGDLTTHIGPTASDTTDVANIYSGDTYRDKILVDGNITKVWISDNTDVSTILDDVAAFDALDDVLTDSSEIAAAAAFSTALGALGKSALEDTFGDDAGAIDAGVNTNGIEIEADSITGGILFEGGGEEIDVETRVGDLGPIDVPRGDLKDFVLDVAGNAGNVTVSRGEIDNDSGGSWSVDGNMGDITAQDLDFDASDMLIGGNAGTFTATIDDIDGGIVIGGSTFGGLRAIGEFSDLDGVELDVAPGAQIGILLSTRDDGLFFSDNPDIDPNNVTILLLGVAGNTDLDGGRVLVGNDTLNLPNNRTAETKGTDNLVVLIDVGAGNDDDPDYDLIKVLNGLAAGDEVIADGDAEQFSVLGNWDGRFALVKITEFDDEGDIDITDPTVNNIDVIGDIGALAQLDVFDFGEVEVTGTNNSEQKFTIAGGDTLNIASNFAGMEQTIWLQGSSKISAEITTTFNKVTKISLSGRGNASIVSVNDTLDADNPDDLRTLKGIQSDTRRGDDNDVLLNGSRADVGEISLATPNTRGKINIDDTVIDGNLGEMHLGFRSSARNVTVTGDAGDLVLGKTVNKLHVEGDLDLLIATTAKNVFIGGAIDELFHVSKASNVYIDGDVNELGGIQLKNVNVLGTTATLSMSGERASIINSYFNNVVIKAFNGDTTFNSIGFLVFGSEDGGNAFTKPFQLVKIRDSFLG